MITTTANSSFARLPVFVRNRSRFFLTSFRVAEKSRLQNPLNLLNYWDVDCYLQNLNSQKKMKAQITNYLSTDRFGCLNAFKSNVPNYFTNEEIKDFEAFLTRLESNNNKTQFYVINYENKIIGCGGFGDKDNTGIISLAWGHVHKDYHKMGYGEKLLKHRMEQIKLLYPEFPVVIDTTQYSYGFFEKYGFKVTKITNDYYEIGMHRYDMILEI